MDIFGNTTQTPTIYHKKHEIEKSGFLGSSNGKESACNAGDLGSTPGSGRSPGGHSNPLQYSSLENSTDKGAWWSPVHRVAKSWT